MGHGTHVCGSIVGTGKLSDGAFKGGANGAKLIIEGLWSAILDNLAPGTDIAALMDPIYQDGARVHSNSWGNARNLGDYDTFAARVDEYMWNNPELLILFAAGNSGVDADHDGRIDEGSVGSPGTAKNVLTVGASKNLLLTGGIQKHMHELRDGEKNWGAEPIASSLLSENPQGLAAFSSRGPTSDGRIKPEIVSPGTNIVSTRSHNPKASLCGALTTMITLDRRHLDGHAAHGRRGCRHARVSRQGSRIRHAFGSARQGDSHAHGHGSLSRPVRHRSATGTSGAAAPTSTRLRPRGHGRGHFDGTETQLVDDKSGVGLSEEKAITVTVGSNGLLRATMVYTDVGLGLGIRALGQRSGPQGHGSGRQGLSKAGPGE